jgi:hypothetical protein
MNNNNNNLHEKYYSKKMNERELKVNNEWPARNYLDTFNENFDLDSLCFIFR